LIYFVWYRTKGEKFLATPCSNRGGVALSIRILIADDNAPVRTAMRQVLETVGKRWEIIEAEDGSEAIAKAQELQPNLVILDLVMPGTDGLAASREIAKSLPEIPILMHTLHSSPRVKLESIKAGVRKLIPKSDASLLISAVEELLQQQPPEPPAKPLRPPSSAAVLSTLGTQEKIRGLCTLLLATQDSEPDAQVIMELQAALHTHIEHLRARLADYPAAGESRVPQGLSLPAPEQTQPPPPAESATPIAPAIPDPAAPSPAS
jgi:DNA-binding NarL/FixJ family response regulator